MKDIIDLLGRILIAFIFLFEAYDSIVFFKATKEKMIDYGITWQTEPLLIAGIFLLILGGVLVLIGYRSGFGATLLLLYWIPITFIVHAWWKETGDLQRVESMNFMKNMAIIGGLLIIIVNGSGRYSIKRLFATTKVR